MHTVIFNASQRLTEPEKIYRFYHYENSLSASDSVHTDSFSTSNNNYNMFDISSHLQWFQAKIGSYDKSIWETSVEQRILQGLENRPKREGSLHKELIDIDLVRGSTFSKAKPRHGLKSVIFNGLKKVIFFPYYYSQWREHLTKQLVYCFTFHYIIQMIQLILYFWWSNSSEIMLEEILLPIILALSLGVLHAHIIAPYGVKQRRKKTFSTSSSKGKTASKTESNVPAAVTKSKPHSTPHSLTTQLSESSHQASEDKVKSDLGPLCQENACCSSRHKMNSVLFTKSSPHNSDLSDEEEHANIDTKTVQPEGYDGETETKDSSSSEPEDSVYKMTDLDATSTVKQNEVNEHSATETICGNGTLKPVTKRVKILEMCERTVLYAKTKSTIRKCSQSDVVAVTDEEALKKFISAKNKHIPDPTPINNSKKEKDKIHRKTLTSTSQKSYKSGKTRRSTTERTGNNSGLSSGSASTGGTAIVNHALQTCMDSFKGINNKSQVPDMPINCTLKEFIMDDILNGNVTNPDTVTDNSSDNQKYTNSRIDTITSKNSALFNEVPSPAEQKICHSQPHTPINHAGTKSRRRIDVRKISSADASPTPSRKNSVPFSVPLHRDLEPKGSQPIIVPEVTNSDANNAAEQGNRVIDTSISSEDYSSKAVDLNEDTITKSHKKREEFKQLFEMKAQTIQIEKGPSYNSAGKLISSTSSSRNSTVDMKPGKSKRRHREEYKSGSNVDSKKKHKKEMVQSMSETEYDRMNSDVNSTGNSTSDPEDLCQDLGATKSEAGNQDVSVQKVEDYEEDISELGPVTSAISKNENNTIVEDVSRPLQSGDMFPSEMAPDDPFVMWYREAHTPGMTVSVSCYIWENDELKKTNLSLLDIGWSIIQAVERHVQEKSYSTFGFFTIIVLCFTPLFFRMYTNRTYLSTVIDMSRHSDVLDFVLPLNSTFIHSIVSTVVTSNTSMSVVKTSLDNVSDHVYSLTNEIIPLVLTSILASEWSIRLIIILGIILRLILYTMTFLMLCVAENSFEQRLQYAKHFCRLTSSRRARKYYLPHFRLNKLANIKCWLSLRSYLKKRGPQRSVESIISSAFYMLLAMLSLVCVNLLQNKDNLFINRLINWDLMLCSVALGVFMMRFLVLGTKITKKYRNLSVIITEQINLFLAMQTRPHKKEELSLAHNVLRLAESLLKEVEGPFRICGWSMNPFLYNILKVVILSVLSTVLSETCGFKMKLYKIKINPANW